MFSSQALPPLIGYHGNNEWSIPMFLISKDDQYNFLRSHEVWWGYVKPFLRYSAKTLGRGGHFDPPSPNRVKFWALSEWLSQILIEIWLSKHEFQNRNFSQLRIFGGIKQFHKISDISFAFPTKVEMEIKVKLVIFSNKLIKKFQNSYKRTKIDK